MLETSLCIWVGLEPPKAQEHLSIIDLAKMHKGMRFTDLYLTLTEGIPGLGTNPAKNGNTLG